MLLGTPIVSDDFVRRTVIHRIDEVAKALHSLTELGDAHNSLTFLRPKFAGTKMNFLLRSVPTHLIAGVAAKYDEKEQAGMQHQCNGMLHPDLFTELQLPLRVSRAKQPHFGLRFTSGAEITPEAYIVSISAASIAQTFLIHKGIDNNREKAGDVDGDSES